MEGRLDVPTERGIIPRAFQHLFESIARSVATVQDQQYMVYATYLEIYNEEIRDLLSKTPKVALDLRQDAVTGFYAEGLSRKIVKNVKDIDHHMQSGKRNRTTGKTNMNEASSRSHSIFTIVVEHSQAGGHIRVGKLNLVDLAGSERASKTLATGQRQVEGTAINVSLTCLGNVITALAAKSKFVPYRESKLTCLLETSLGGNAKTVMCANCSPVDFNCEETISTLKYANRAKNIKNKPQINEDPKDAMLKGLQEQIRALQEQLGKQGAADQPLHAATAVETRVVEREVIREVHVGLSDEQVQAIHRQAREEKEMLMKQAKEDMQQLIVQQSQTAAERAALQDALQREAEDKRVLAEREQALQNKLRAMEAKLIKGGAIISKAAQQEALLRKTEQELKQKQQVEAVLAKELAAKEEANEMLEDHYSSLQEEVQVKTNKLKKLLAKYQTALRDAHEMEADFATERNGMLEKMQSMAVEMEKKELLVANFIPNDYAQRIQARLVCDAAGHWMLPKGQLAGNCVLRPVSHSKLRRPESEYARQQRALSGNPRYRYDNILSLGLDAADKTTQHYAHDADMQVKYVLEMDLDAEDGEIDFASNPTPTPYLSYHTKAEDKPSARHAAARPRSAARQRAVAASAGDEWESCEGLVSYRK